MSSDQLRHGDFTTQQEIHEGYFKMTRRDYVPSYYETNTSVVNGIDHEPNIEHQLPAWHVLDVLHATMDVEFAKQVLDKAVLSLKNNPSHVHPKVTALREEMVQKDGYIEELETEMDKLREDIRQLKEANKALKVENEVLHEQATMKKEAEDFEYDYGL
ncbi:Hypothetical protein D9617_18g032950 [Elsinoe fawcettii]|nr:Hypothetical protein D9617_18g032950 [Elsinoe fawcettii]